MSRIVLDANIVGRGRFNRRQLDRLVEYVQGTMAWLVIPEVVIWEWAEHAHLAIDGLARQQKELGVDPAVFATPPPIAVPTKDELIETISAAIPQGYEIWKPSESDLADAVRAQVLQVGTGERKHGVKTGVADHLVLAAVRHVQAEAGATEPVVFGTNDGALAKACEAEFGEDVIIASDMNRLLRSLAEFRPAAQNLVESVEADLHQMLQPGSMDVYSVLHLVHGFDIHDDQTHQQTEPGDSERATLGVIDIIEVEDLEVGELRDDGTHVGTANVRLFGSVHMEVRGYEQIGEDEFETVIEWEGDVPGMVDMPMTLTFDQDWTLSAVEAAGRALIEFNA